MYIRKILSKPIMLIITFLIIGVVTFAYAKIIYIPNMEKELDGKIIVGIKKEVPIIIPKNKKIETLNTKIVASTTKSTKINKMHIMAWIYPGQPACAANTEIADGRKIDTLKAEFFTIIEGSLKLINASNNKCNGYSLLMISELKKYSTYQYATVSSTNLDDMQIFLDSALSDSSDNINILVNFSIDNNISGIELDFEDFSSWTPEAYEKYKKFVNALGLALHAKGKKLMIDGPAVSDAIEEKWFVWKYEDFLLLPVDNIVVMAYDYQYDHGVGSGITPLNWLKSVVTWTSSRYTKSKITIGLPSYGYKGVSDSYKTTNLTKEQMTKEPGFKTAKRDTDSGEMTWQNQSMIYFYQDSKSLNQKLEIVRSLGINYVSIWHLGGNPWF